MACGGLVFAGALTFGELASRYPVAGGLYVYLREGWGARVAFLYGWQSLLIMDPGVAAALATGLSEYAVLLWGPAGGAERWIAIAVIWLLAIVSMAGLGLSAGLLAAMTVLKCLAFAGVFGLALAAGSGSWSHFEPFAARHANAVPLAEAVGLAFVGIFFSFGGFWEASRIAGEVSDAPRTMPVALAVGVSAVTVIYFATTVAFVYLAPVGHMTSASAFAQRAGEAMLGPAGPAALGSVVILSVIASLLALLIMAPRLYVAMHQDRLFPGTLASVSQSRGAPARATALLAVLASGYVLAGTFQEILAFFMCTTLVFVSLAAAALFAVRRRVPERPPFQLPGYPVTPVLFIGLVAAVVVLIAVSRPLPAVAGIIIVLLGLPAYTIFARRLRPGRQVFP
jgi:APA family basic amino acid/polyamine antiporter